MREKLRILPTQPPRSLKEARDRLLQNITVANSELKRARKELKRLEIQHGINKSNPTPDEGNKKVFDGILEPKFRNPYIVKKRYEVMKLEEEISALNRDLNKLQSPF